MAEELLFTKIVDKSALTHGITIPVAYQKALFDKLGFFLRRGEARPITIQIGGYLFDDATLANEAFDEIKYPNRADIVQIRYGANSLLARRLRELFGSTSELLDEIYTHRQKAKTSLIIPEDKREYIIIYAGNGTIRFDCVTRNNENHNVRTIDFGEEAPQRKETVAIGFKRNANVIERTKQRARGICQLCGRKAPFNDKQGNPYLEVHHIIWLSRGGADKLSNTAALCPNCHAKMHIVDDDKDIALLLERAKIE